MWSQQRWNIHKNLSAAQRKGSCIVFIFDLEASSGNTFIVIVYRVVLMAILSRKMISCNQNGLTELPPPAESMH